MVFQTCFYCKTRGASVGCCGKSCRKSFHFSCGVKNRCLTEYVGNFFSFCHQHASTRTSNTSKEYEPDDECEICQKPMGEYDRLNSLKAVCCPDDKWFHKRCLKEQALLNQDDFSCPCCGNSDEFRDNLLINGIFIPKGNDVARYQSFAIAEEDAQLEMPQKKRRIHKNWIFVRTFESKEEADKFLEDENWSYSYKNVSSDGIRITYRCKLVKFRGKQCEAGIYLLFDSRSSNIQLFRADSEHTHENDPNKVDVIAPEIEKVIRELYENNVSKPKAMQTNLLNKGIEPPPLPKLKTLLKKLNDQKYGSEKLNYGLLEKWLQDESSSYPDGETEPFVLSYEIFSESEFRFVVTTKQLLKLAIGSQMIHADATYKLIWQGFPVFVVGKTDLHRAFHPFGIGVCTTETAKDFEFIFTAIKEGVSKIFSETFQPKYLISDAAKAIHNGGKKVFGDDLFIIMCAFHMYKNVREKLPSFIRDNLKQSQFLNDLQKLQLAKTDKAFDVAVGLFMDKWRAESAELTQYFRMEWVDQNRFWYEGFAKLMPSTNNALESFNRLIKDEQTLRERMDLGKFRMALYKMTKEWSIKYISSVKTVYLDAPELTLPLWTAGYLWARANNKISSRKRGNFIIYRSILSFIETIDDSNDWDSFDVYRKKSFEFNDTKFKYPITRDNWFESECDCENYFKLYICEHIIGIALRIKCIIPPAEAKAIPIGEKRKRGRPPKAKSALKRQ